MKKQKNNKENQNSWRQRPLQVGIITAILTGLVFALVLQCYGNIKERKDIIGSLDSELSYNYEIIKSIQAIDTVNQENSGSAIEDELLLQSLHNMSIDDQLSVDIWNSLQIKISQYSKKYSKYNEMYKILERIIRFSRIKRGEIHGSVAEQAALQNYDAISENSKSFIEKFEANFGGY